jgi:hypothetical protein
MDTFDTFLRILLDPEDEDLEPLLNSSSTDITPSPPPISPPKRNTLPTADNPFDEGHPIHIQMTLYTEFPSISQTLPAPCTDKVPSQPVFFGAAILSEEPLVSIPCKVTPKLWPSVCHVPLDGREIVHRGKYNIVPFDTEKMELVTVPKHVNELPEGRKLVVGGRDRDGEELYHAVGVYHNLRIPGKVSRSLANMVSKVPAF